MKTVDDMKEIIVRFLQGRPEVVAVYLFGSQARDRAKPSSDVDLAILLDPQEKLHEFKLKRDLMVGLSRVLYKDVHLVFLNRAGETLSSQVFKYGECLYNANPQVLSRFRTGRFSQIADFAYLKKIMETGFTRKLLEGAR